MRLPSPEDRTEVTRSEANEEERTSEQRRPLPPLVFSCLDRTSVRVCGRGFASRTGVKNGKMSSLDYLDLCRLCLVKDRVSVPIFEDEGDVRQIFLKITACLPVKVSLRNCAVPPSWRIAFSFATLLCDYAINRCPNAGRNSLLVRLRMPIPDAANATATSCGTRAAYSIIKAATHEQKPTASRELVPPLCLVSTTPSSFAFPAFFSILFTCSRTYLIFQRFPVDLDFRYLNFLAIRHYVSVRTRGSALLSPSLHVFFSHFFLFDHLCIVYFHLFPTLWFKNC